MRSKKTEKEIIKDTTVTDGPIIYRYLLYASRSRKVASFNLPLYSIEIIMLKDGESSNCSSGELFSDVGKAISFYNKLKDNLATPIDLPFIIEDCQILTH